MTTNNDLRRQIINEIIGIEGDFVNDKRDAGGATKYGITDETAKRHGLNVRHITIEDAFSIYIDDYWQPLKLDQVAVISPALAKELFEQNINLRYKQAGRHLQRALNSLNNQETIFPDIEVDGKIGNQTLNALRSYYAYRGHRGDYVLLNLLNAFQSAYYVERSEKRPQNEAFNYGWQLNRVTPIDSQAVQTALEVPQMTTTTTDLPPYSAQTEPPYYRHDEHGFTPVYDDPVPPQGETAYEIRDPAYEAWKKEEAAKKDSKPWYTSKIAIKQAVGLASTGLALFGLDISPQHQAYIVAGAATAIQLGTFISRIWFTSKRIR